MFLIHFNVIPAKESHRLDVPREKYAAVKNTEGSRRSEKHFDF